MKQLLINKESLDKNGFTITGGVLNIIANKDNRLIGKKIPVGVTMVDVELGVESLSGGNIRFIINIGKEFQNVIVANHYTYGDGKFLRLILLNFSKNISYEISKDDILVHISFVEPVKLISVEAPTDGFKTVKSNIKSDDVKEVKTKPKKTTKKKKPKTGE